MLKASLRPETSSWAEAPTRLPQRAAGTLEEKRRSLLSRLLRQPSAAHSLMPKKKRVYAPIERSEGIGWKEFQSGISRIMQDYCGEYKTEETLKVGLTWLNSIRESEGSRVCARNPHELARTLECFSRLTCGEIIMHASLGRKASSNALDFKRLDYPEKDPPEWNKFVVVSLAHDQVKTGELLSTTGLEAPNAPTLEENYRNHCSLPEDSQHGK